MKKLLLYIGAVAAVLAVSCTNEITEEIVQSGECGLEIIPQCLAPQTRAYENYSAGVDALNENNLDYIDYYVFTNEAGTTYLKDGNNNNIEGRITGVTSGEVAKSIVMDDYLGQLTNNKVYVYVIANYPSENHPTGTLTQLSKLSVATAFDTYDTWNAEDAPTTKFVGKSKFKKSDNFVMTGWKAVTIAKGHNDGIVDLARLAAKITVNVNVTNKFDEYVVNNVTQQSVYKMTWSPNVPGFRCYLMYGSKQTDINDEPRLYTDEEKDTFFSYDSYSFIADEPVIGSETTLITGSPMYTYPVTWNLSDSYAPFLKLIIPWNGIQYNLGTDGKPDYNSPTANTKSDVPYYYKIYIPDTEALVKNTWYNLTINVGMLGSSNDDVLVELPGYVYVVDWNKPSETIGGTLNAGTYLKIAKDVYYIYGIEDLDATVISSHDLTSVTITKREVWSEGAWVTSISSPDNAEPENLSTRGTIVSFTKDNIKFRDTLIKEMGTTLDTKIMRFTVTVTNAAGLTATYQIIQYPSIYTEEIAGDCAFVNGYFGHVNIYGNSTYYKRPYGTSVSTNNTPSTIYSLNRTPVAYNNTSNSNFGSSTTIGVSYGNMTTNNSSGQSSQVSNYMIKVSVSAFGSDSDSYNVTYNGTEQTYKYIIADPRTDIISGSDLANYYTFAADNGSGEIQGTSSTASWGNVSIKVGDTSTDDPGRNYIAPEILISSTWGRNPSNSSATFENCQKRCATYQEAGYPAGRWRLPTEAEAVFIANLQANGKISPIFNVASSGEGTYYWLSNGTAVNISTDYKVTVATRTGASLRCVYDLWYWGDDKVTPYIYTIKP